MLSPERCVLRILKRPLIDSQRFYGLYLIFSNFFSTQPSNLLFMNISLRRRAID